MTLELGGNAAVIVEPDADLAHAVEGLTFGAFAYAGQVCLSTSASSGPPRSTTSSSRASCSASAAWPPAIRWTRRPSWAR